MCCHDSTYTTIGNVKDVDPKLLQGVLNFIEMNTQIPEKIEVLEDVKQDLGMSTTDIPGTDIKDEIGTLRALNKVSFGIQEQCKLIADLSYQMDDVGCGETVLGHLTDLYKHMYDVCRKDGLLVPLRKDHLKFIVLCGQKRKKKGLLNGRRIVPLYPTKTAKARQARHSHFGRKSNFRVTETTIKEMLGAKGSDDDNNETLMEVSDGDKDVVPFVDLASYRCLDEQREKVLTTPGLLQCQHTNCQVKYFHISWPYLIHLSHPFYCTVKRKPGKTFSTITLLHKSLFLFCSLKVYLSWCQKVKHYYKL